MIIKIYPENPNPRAVQQVVDCLQSGGVIIYPTDTIYGIGCDIYNAKQSKGSFKFRRSQEKASMSFICHDLSQLSNFTTPINNTIFKAMRRALPGPFTFILNASNVVPKIIHGSKKTVGIRVPDNNIIREIVRVNGNPILSSSVKDDDDVIEYTTDPELIHEAYGDLVDIVIDGGYGDNVPSTVVDCTSGEIEVIREGKGDLDLLFG